MKSVLMFDTGVATLNTGDEIINYSIKKNWPEIYNDNYIMTFPTHTPSFHWWQNLLMKKNSIYANADYKFLCGTNILYTNMLRPEPAWNLFLPNTQIAQGTICVGTGIGINSKKTTNYTKRFFNKVLSHDYVHSVRDEKTKVFLEEMGFKAWNTGCPTLWDLTPEFCTEIPSKKSDKVIFTLTSYESDKHNDQLMINILINNYKEVYYWPQSLGDAEYLKRFKNTEKIKVIAPNLAAYDQILNEDIDYVGNRLHGGIFALQHKCRTIIISIDYRAEEMSTTYSFKCIKRTEIINSLDNLINSEWETKITGLDFEKIAEWKRQFE